MKRAQSIKNNTALRGNAVTTLRVRMAERSIKVGQLAEMTGVSRSYLSETLCRNAVSKSAAIKINSALGEEIFT